MSKRKQPSGYTNRQRKAAREKEESRQSAALLKFFQSVENNSNKQDDNHPQTANETSENEKEEYQERGEIQQNLATDKEVTENEVQHQSDPLPNSSTSCQEDVGAAFDYSDPGKWPKSISNRLRQTIVIEDVKQIQSHDFPKDKNNRRFSVAHYKKRLPNGEEVCREWLVYSVSNNAVFCFCCKLFSKKDGLSVLQEGGSSDWKNISAVLSSHEKSLEHLENFLSWRELQLRLSKGKTVDDDNQRDIQEQERYWNQVLQRLIALVRVLAMQNLAFRGSNEKLYCTGNGNFLKFLEFLALFDPVMEKHLQKVQNQETTVHYLGKEIQNELIHLLAKSIKEKILAKANLAKYFSIILDCTPDVGHVEQMSIIVRFVDITTQETGESTGEKVVIKEHFLGFVPLQETTGAFLTETLLCELEKMGLSIDNLRGQEYDNGSNMRGKVNGVQNRVRNINPRAFFVPCSAHSLNLVVNDAAKSCLSATSFFILVQKIYTYFSASTKRWEVLKQHLCGGLTVKPLSDTRWESRVDALKPLRYNLANVYDALMEIFEDISLVGSSGNESRAEAFGLAAAVSKFNFVVCLVTWYNILFEVNLTSKLIQKRDCDLNACTMQLQTTKRFLEKCRSDKGFEQTLVDAAEVAKEIEIPSSFDQEPVRRRKRKRQYDETEDDTASETIDPKQQFKFDFYFPVLDMAIQSIDERFVQLQQHTSLFGFLYDIYHLKEKPSDEILHCCKLLEQSLTHEEDRDIDHIDLCSELTAVARRLPKSLAPQDVLKFLAEQKLLDSVPNLAIALRILLTLPVSVASAERSFSKLNLIKTFVRSTMVQERLDSLAIISIEPVYATSLDMAELIKNFAKQKARKMPFY